MKNSYRNAKMFAIFLVSVLVLGLAACGAPASSSGSQRSVLRVGVECACAPFNWTQMDDSYGAMPLDDGTFAGGYDVEIAKLIAEAMDMDLQIVKIDWDGLIPALTSEKIDAIIADMSPTEDRKQTIDFSDIYYKSDLVIVVRTDSPYVDATSLDDFDGAKLTGQLGTLLYEVLDQIPGVDKQSAAENHPEMIIATVSGRVDGYVCERPNAISASMTNPELTFVSFTPENGFNYDGTDVSIAVGLRKGDPLKDQINAALATISEETRLQLMEQCIQNHLALVESGATED